MPRTARKVESLVDEDPGFEGALRTVLERVEDGDDDEVKWVDVRDDLSSGQWGRLIEEGLLVDGEAGFRLADPDSVREALDGTDGSGSVSTSTGTDGDDEDTSWSVYDKAAAVFSVGLFAGYTWAPMRNLIGNAMNVVLGPLEATLPFYAVVMILAVLTGLYSTILQANLMNTDKMAEYQEKMQEIQDKRKAAKEAGDDEALERIQDEQMEAMGDQLGMFKEQFRPMVWIMFLTIPVFLWMYWGVGIRGADSHFVLEPLILPLVGERAWTESVLGPIQVWIVWYFLCSMGFTQIIRKGLNINISPTG